MEQVSLDEAQRRLPALARRAVAGERVRIEHDRTSGEIIAGRTPASPRTTAHPTRLRELRKDLNFEELSILELIEAGRE